MLVVALILFTMAVFTIGVGAAGSLRKLPRNRFLGVTTPEALRTDEAFVVANRIAGPTTTVAGVMLGFAGLALLAPLGTLVSGAVAVVAVGTAIYTAGTGASLGTHAADAVAPASDLGSCGSACGSCALKDACAP